MVKQREWKFFIGEASRWRPEQDSKVDENLTAEVIYLLELEFSTRQSSIIY